MLCGWTLPASERARGPWPVAWLRGSRRFQGHPFLRLRPTASGFAGNFGLYRAQAELLDRHGVEAAHHLLLHIHPDGPDHLLPNVGTFRHQLRVGSALDLAYDSADLAYSYV